MNVTEFLRARLGEEDDALPRDGGYERRRAELHAMRAILDLHQGASDVWGFHGCLTCGNVADTTAGYPCPTVRELAAIYDDHPDYDTAWRPR